MEDEGIVRLYWERDENAIMESAAKYGNYCASISRNILHSEEDTEECVNDTWLRAWDAMPPQKPSVLSAFFGRITRNLAFDRYKTLHREKRGGGEPVLALEELAECVSGNADVEHQLEAKELAAEISRFLYGLTAEKRSIFVLRYWHAESVRSIAKRFETSENRISVLLSRIRAKLKKCLIERGYYV